MQHPCLASFGTLAAACALWTLTAAAQAQPVARSSAPAPAASATSPTTSSGTVTRHRITTGDTLEQLSRHYLGDATLWQQVQSHNQIRSPLRLKPGAILEIPSSLLRLSTASVDFLQGRVSVLPPPSRSGSAGAPATETALQPGQQLPEGSRLRVAPDSFVSVRLADGSLLKVQADSEVLLQQLRRKGRTGSLQSMVQLQSGAVEASVPPNTIRPAALEIRTGTATSSVRGTEFGVYVTADGSTATAVQQGAVQVAAVQDAGAQTRVTKGHGAAVSPNGRLHQSTLLPAVPAEQLPTLAEDAQFLDLPLPAPAAGTGYVVQVSQDAAGKQVLRNGRFASGKARLAAVPDGAYYLRVQAVDAHGIPGLPAQTALKVKAHPVPPLYQTAPQAVLPTDGVDLQCTPVHGVAAYRIQIASADQDFRTPLRDEVIRDSCALQGAQLATGNYQWRTASIRMLDNGQPDQGPFAAPQAFRAAQRPAQMDPASLDWQTSGGVPTMHWQGEPGQSWRVVVGLTPEADAPVLDTRVDQPQWQASQLSPGKYFLRLQTRDPSGLESTLSAAREFTVLPWVRDAYGIPIRSGTGHEVISP